MSTLKSLVLSCVAAIGLLASCSFGKNETLPTYAVKRMDYEDVLVVEGYTETVNSLNINCPPRVGGTIVYIVENGTEVKRGDVVCIIEDVNLAENCERLALDLESARAEVEILQLERAGIERDLLYKKIEAAKVMQEMDLVRVEKRIKRMERRLEGERRKLESLTLTAPCDGIAVRGRRWHWSDVMWNIGDHVNDGRTVVALPDFRQLKVLFHAQETEYKRLYMGDSVMFTFDALPENRGWGRIVKIASMGQERTEGSQVKTFEVEVSVDSLRTPVEPGLSTRCHIYMKHISDVIVVPTISVFERDSLKVVYVQTGQKYEERLVELGIGSPKMTIIADGLREGEQIALIKPKGF